MSVRVEQTGFCIRRGGPDCRWEADTEDACGIGACDAGIERIYSCDHCREDVDDASDLVPVGDEWVCPNCIEAEKEG
jgi:hypothetical protein